MASFEDHVKRAKAREEEEQRLGIITHQQKMAHRDRRAILGKDYLERDSGTWRNALDFLKRLGEGKDKK